MPFLFISLFDGYADMSAVLIFAAAASYRFIHNYERCDCRIRLYDILRRIIGSKIQTASAPVYRILCSKAERNNGQQAQRTVIPDIFGTFVPCNDIITL